MILNSQVWIDDMSNEFLSIMIIEFSNWLRFDQSQELNLQLIINNLRDHFINERIVSSFDVNQWLQWVLISLLESIHSVVKDSEAKESSDMLIVEEINTSFIASLMKVSSFLSRYSRKTFSHSLYSLKWWSHVDEKWMHEMQKCRSCSAESNSWTNDRKSCRCSRWLTILLTQR